MFSLLLLSTAVQFVLVDRQDPMTDTRQVAYAATNDDGTIAIGCAGPNQLFVLFLPRGYYGPGSSALLWEPNASYRFGKEPVQKADWTWSADAIELGDLWGTNGLKAKFVDSLARNNVLYFRWEARIGEEHTSAFLYEASSQQIQAVLQACDPKRVRAELTKMRSPLTDAAAK